MDEEKESGSFDNFSELTGIENRGIKLRDAIIKLVEDHGFQVLEFSAGYSDTGLKIVKAKFEVK